MAAPALPHQVGQASLTDIGLDFLPPLLHVAMLPHLELQSKTAALIRDLVRTPKGIEEFVQYGGVSLFFLLMQQFKRWEREPLDGASEPTPLSPFHPRPNLHATTTQARRAPVGDIRVEFSSPPL